MNRSAGLTLIELLVAIAILGIVFIALATAQINNLRVAARSQAATEAKTSAVRQMEQLNRDILTVPNPALTVPEEKYPFLRYYKLCRTTPEPLPTGVPTVSCASAANANPSWSVTSLYQGMGATLIKGEGLIRVDVTATDTSNRSYTVTDILSCYDVYPAPLATAPDPCPKVLPNPTLGGTGGT